MTVSSPFKDTPLDCPIFQHPSNPPRVLSDGNPQTSGILRAYKHPENSQLVETLRRYLPETLPLLRRLEFWHRTENAYVFASSPAWNSSGHDAIGNGWEESRETVQRCLTACYVDRSRQPETEAWIFSTLEIADQLQLSEDERKTCRRQIWSILRIIKNLGLRGSPSKNGDTYSVPVQNLEERTAAEQQDIDILRIGSMHVDVEAALREWGMVRKTSERYVKFLFKMENLPTSKGLPPKPVECVWPGGETGTEGEKTMVDFAFDDRPMTLAELRLTMSRTDIPRLERTLCQLRCAKVFASPVADTQGQSLIPPKQMVAWCFLSADGSLASLHCEKSFRGLGLAKAVALRVFTKPMEDEGGTTGMGKEGLAHADVATTNVQSAGLCRGLGGREAWDIYWTWVDLGAVDFGGP